MPLSSPGDHPMPLKAKCRRSGGVILGQDLHRLPDAVLGDLSRTDILRSTPSVVLRLPKNGERVLGMCHPCEIR